MPDDEMMEMAADIIDSLDESLTMFDALIILAMATGIMACLIEEDEPEIGPEVRREAMDAVGSVKMHDLQIH